MSGSTQSTPQWPSFQGQAELVGTSQSGRATIYVDPSLGASGMQNATDLLADADRIIAANDALFATSAGRVDVIIFALGGATDGTGGADHASCDYVTGNAIEVCAAFGTPLRVSALFEAELSECNMGGQLCGANTGEALSRWCAASVSGNALADFATAPTWFQSGTPDFVDMTDPTDQNAVSTGCGMAFISWLLSKGYTLPTIAQGLVSQGTSGTFAQLYAALSGGASSDAWTAFLADIQALPNGVQSDDPFSAPSAPSLAMASSHRLRMPA